MSEYEGEHRLPDNKPFWLSDKAYNVLKWMAQIVLPALATFYLTIGALWELPQPEKVAATIVALDTFLGVILLITTNSYNNSDARFDGTLNITQLPNRKVFEIDLGDNTPEAVQEKDEFVLKVNPTS